jgi:VIT1/CCC1 family predicted Fe2+/Mn2+ transporter
MGTGAYLSSYAENQLIASEIADQRAEALDHPELEQRELQILFQEEGLSEADARTAREAIGHSLNVLVKTKIEKELGLPFHDTKTAKGDGYVVGVSYACAALIPLGLTFSSACTSRWCSRWSPPAANCSDSGC